MGCFDVYCFICGNTCYSSDYIYSDYLYDQKLLNKLMKKEKTKLSNSERKELSNIKKMYKNYSDNFVKNLKELSKNTKWMNKCTMLLSSNKIVHGLEEVQCNVGFRDKKNNIYEHTGFTTKNNENIGIFLHTDCYKYVKKKYNIELLYKDIPIINVNGYYQLKNQNYGKIEKYHEQYFDFKRLINDNNQYLCSSPLINDKNIGQINKNIKALKIKGDRPSPSVSATFYKDGIYKLGNNKKIWKIKSGKWIEIKEPLIKKSIIVNENNKLINKISFEGMYSKNPIFIISVKNKKKMKIYTIIKTENYKIKL